MEYTGLHFIESADVSIDIFTHDDFVVSREFAKESIQSVKEAGIYVVD